uniref:Uncharacterized protein n=1 Tax=Anguilla anguilla TaxID=7936 RepID=A0A0E9PLD4_ANGAN
MLIPVYICTVNIAQWCLRLQEVLLFSKLSKN